MFTGNNIPEEIRFLDINGKLSYSQKTSSPRGQTIEINISNLPQGVYVAEIVSSMGLFRQKLIKLE
ncbi:MAG: T9SS type A sorting domain-containing protein [Sphingobacteriaceae bacterium]|nr:T9SS type A sorting domain-containing protein [Sphingobacteriaceae bacterium]